MKFLILYKANPKVGLGHQKRANAIKCYLESISYDVGILNVEHEDFKNWIPQCSEAVILFDIPEDNLQKYLPKRIRLNSPLIALDYFGSEKLDLVLSAFNHFPNKQYNNTIFSTNFFIIRDEILKLKNQISKNGSPLIMPGGGDALDQSKEMISKMETISRDYLFIQGPLQKSPPPINANLIRLNPKNLPEIMASSIFGLTNGGGSMIEMIYLEKPVFVFPQSQFEKNLADHFLKNSLIFGVNNKNKISEKIIDFTPSPNIIDGKGVENIVSEIKKFLSIQRLI